MTTQEHIRKVIEDVREDGDFMRRLWISAVEYLNGDRGITSGCFGDIKTFCKNGKLDKVVAIVKSSMPNVLGDLTVTLKDPLAIQLKEKSLMSLKRRSRFGLLGAKENSFLYRQRNQSDVWTTASKRAERGGGRLILSTRLIASVETRRGEIE
ncbi:hypothetical protein Tco_0784067 [Tanacetum coccineum]